MREDEVLAEFITNIDVYDREWDITTYEDVKFGEAAQGVLVITDLDDLVVAMYAHGAWTRDEVSREPRLESNGDTPTTDGETDGSPTAERHADLPRDGA